MTRSLTVVNTSDYANEDVELQFSDGSASIMLAPGEQYRFSSRHQSHVRLQHIREQEAEPLVSESGAETAPIVKVEWSEGEPDAPAPASDDDAPVVDIETVDDNVETLPFDEGTELDDV